MKENFIHKVHITFEARFDYEECLELGILPKTDLKNAVEDYLYIRQREEKPVRDYFRLKYLDEESDEMLLLFVKKCCEFSSMRIWEISGICKETDYDDEYEYLGKNKAWYESPVDITGLPKTDWVTEIGKNVERLKNRTIV